MIALIIVCIMFIALLIHTHIQDYRRSLYIIDLCNRWGADMKRWDVERQQLLDRIQAPSYDHLKHHEAKIIKASKEPLKETNTLEVV